MSGRRIAYLTSEYPAASHTFIRREVEALRARGLSLETFSVRHPAAETQFSPGDQEALRTTTFLLPIGLATVMKTHLFWIVRRPGRYLASFRQALRHRVPGLRSWLWSCFYFVEAVALAERLVALRIEHLHNHFANSSANVGLLASHLVDIPWSVTLHGTADWDYPAGYLLRDKIQSAAFVACVSQFGRAQAMGTCAPSDWPKMFVARCGLDLSRLPPKRPASAPSSPKRILAVGRLSPEKGQLGLLESFAVVVGRGTDATLRIVGDGPLRESLANKIIELGMQGRCTLVGQKTEQEVLDELAAADLFVQSSFMEGLPVVLIESLAMRVPTIAPRVAGIPELIHDGETGLLFTAGDWDDLAVRIEQALRDPELGQKMSERGHTIVVDEFEINRAVEPLLQRFSSV